MRQDDINEREWRKRENWHAGPLGAYASKDDDRAFVPKRHRSLGVTPNLSTGTGLGFMIGVVLFIALILWLSVDTNDREGPETAPTRQLER
jgi:uncharacterized membrane protein